MASFEALALTDGGKLDAAVMLRKMGETLLAAGCSAVLVRWLFSPVIRTSASM